MSDRKTHTESIILRCLFLLAAGFLIFLHLYLQLPGLDAGLHLYGSFLITKGHFPYADLWNNKPPLIYIIGTLGFLVKSNPFLGIRLLEIAVYFTNLVLLWRIVKIANLGNPFFYLLSFSAIYAVTWDGGFLTETFHIPLVLLSVYYLLKKVKYYEFIGALLLVASFYLKQNAGVIIIGVVLTDILANYRPGKRSGKIARYAIALVIYSLIPLIILYHSPIWNDFLEQVFIYNASYAEHSSLVQFFINHFRHNSFLSIKGISVVMIFNIAIFFTLRKYWLLYRKGVHRFTTPDQVLAGAVFLYLFSYWFVYISGKTYPHYFILLIVPATLLFGDYVRRTLSGKLALVLLLAVGVNQNILTIKYYPERAAATWNVVSFLRNNSDPDECIHIAGFGNQYIYVMANRLSNTKFILPLTENEGYTEKNKDIIAKDFSNHPPLFIVINKISNRQLDPANFYTQVINETIKNSLLVFENNFYAVYKRNK